MDIVLLRPAIVTYIIVEAAKVVDIGLNISATLTKVIVEVVDVGQV